MTAISRGDIVLVDFPQQSGGPPKRRPALVVQSDHNNARLSNSIFVITSNTTLSGKEPTQVLIDITTSEGMQGGLAFSSAVKCENLYTLAISSVRKRLGRLPVSLLPQVDAALKASLALP